jgi:hypothetical protein
MARVRFTSIDDARIINNAVGFNDADQRFQLAITSAAGNQIRSAVDGVANDFVMALPTGEFHQLAMTYDGSDIRLYWDAVLKKTVAHVGTVPANGAAGSVIGAAGNDAASRNFNGDIDFALIAARAFSVEELEDLMIPTKFPREKIYCVYGFRGEAPGVDLTDLDVTKDDLAAGPDFKGRRTAGGWPTYGDTDIYRPGRRSSNQ